MEIDVQRKIKKLEHKRMSNFKPVAVHKTVLKKKKINLCCNYNRKAFLLGREKMFLQSSSNIMIMQGDKAELFHALSNF